MLDIVWSGEIVTRAHHGGSASSNSEAERFGRIPADRDRKEHGGEETVTGANRTFRLYGGGRQKKLSGGSGKDCAVMAHGQEAGSSMKAAQRQLDACASTECLQKTYAEWTKYVHENYPAHATDAE